MYFVMWIWDCTYLSSLCVAVFAAADIVLFVWYVGQTSRSLNVRFQEHTRYIRNNNPHSAYAQHILQNQHEYGQMNNIMTLLKPLNNPNLLIPYEQYYNLTLYLEDKLIPEQYPGETNPLFQMAINPQPPYTTWTEQ